MLEFQLVGAGNTMCQNRYASEMLHCFSVGTTTYLLLVDNGDASPNR